MHSQSQKAFLKVNHDYRLPPLTATDNFRNSDFQFIFTILSWEFLTSSSSLKTYQKTMSKEMCEIAVGLLNIPFVYRIYNV